MTKCEFLTGHQRIKESDLKAIKVLFHQLNKRHDEITARMIKSYATRVRFLTARNDSEMIVGMGSLVVVPRIPASMGWVSNVVVLDSERGKGIGRGLMNALINEAHKLSVCRIDLSSSNDRPEAHGLYESLGFKKRDTTSFRLDL